MISQCKNNQSLIPINGKSTLVLLNNGHIDHLSCWQQNAQIFYPNEEVEDSFPFIINMVSIDSNKSIKKLEIWKSTKIDMYNKWINSELNQEDSHKYETHLQMLYRYQKKYESDQVSLNYIIFFKQIHWKKLVLLKLATPDFRKILTWAIHNNQPHIVESVSPYIKLNFTVDGNLSYIALASLYGYTAVAENLIKWFPETHNNYINHLTKDSLSCLHFASRSLHYDLAKLLLNKGIDRDTLDSFTGRTPLAYAIERGSLRLPALYLSEGANPNIKLVIQVGPNDKLQSFSYLDLVDKYLKPIKPHYHAFYKAFNYVLNGNFHLIDRQSTEDLIPLKFILSEPEYCNEFIISNKQLQQILESGPTQLPTPTPTPTNEDRTYLCTTLSESIDYTEIFVKINSTLTNSLKCLYCNLPFNNIDEMFTIESMIKCGVIHNKCSVNHFVNCHTCQKLIVDVREPTLIKIEQTFHHTEYITPTPTPTPTEIQDFLNNSF